MTTEFLLYFLFRNSRQDLQLYISSAIITSITIIFTIKFWKSIQIQFKKIGLLNIYFLIGIIFLGIFLIFNYFYHSFIIYFSGIESEINLRNTVNNKMNW